MNKHAKLIEQIREAVESDDDVHMHAAICSFLAEERRELAEIHAKMSPECQEANTKAAEMRCIDADIGALLARMRKLAPVGPYRGERLAKAHVALQSARFQLQKALQGEPGEKKNA